MAFDDLYRRQVALLLRAIPFIAREDCFALKGGTAINLFVRNLPRLPAKHRKFLIGFEAGEPDWSLLGIAGVDKLPAVKWRQQNLDKLTKKKRAALVAQLQSVLEQDA